MNVSFWPIAVSLLIHSLVGAAFFVSWKGQPEPRRITPPNYIEAKLVKLKTETKKVAKKKQPKKVDLTKRKSASQPQKASPAPTAKKKESKPVDTKKEDAEKKAKEEARKKQEQRRQQMLEELEEDLKAENLTSAEDESESEAISFKQVILNKVVANWSRPPSSRNGMKCELLIEIVPTGRVVNVTVVDSSGNGAFDRSARQAVLKAESFPELQEMSPGTFEKYYRRFHLIFNPQDLRQ